MSERTGDADTTLFRRPRRRRGPGGLTALGIFVIVILAILAIGDRVAAKVAADEIETRVVAELGARGVTADSTRAEVSGFPFLTQVADGRYDEITLGMTNVRLRGATLPWLDVVARDVTANTGDLIEGTAKVRADRVSGTALVDYPTLVELVDYGRFGLTDVSFASAGDGAVRVRGTARLLGRFDVPVAATANLAAVDGALRVRVTDLNVEGAQVPAGAQSSVDALVRRLSVTVRLPALPFDLALDDVRGDDRGLRISATARGVALAS